MSAPQPKPAHLVCEQCKRELHQSNFWHDNSRPNTYKAFCITCTLANKGTRTAPTVDKLKKQLPITTDAPSFRNRRYPTAEYPNRGKTWTRKETAMVKAMISGPEGYPSPAEFADMALKLGRTPKSVSEHYRTTTTRASYRSNRFSNGMEKPRVSNDVTPPPAPYTYDSLRSMAVTVPVPDDWGVDFELQRAEAQRKLDAFTKPFHNTELTAPVVVHEPTPQPTTDNEVILRLLAALTDAYKTHTPPPTPPPPSRGWLRRLIGF